MPSNTPHLYWTQYLAPRILPKSRGNCIYILSVSAMKEEFFVRTIFDPSFPEEEMSDVWRERIDLLRRSNHHGIVWQGVSYQKILESILKTPKCTPDVDDHRGLRQYNCAILSSTMNIFLGYKTPRLELLHPEMRALLGMPRF